MYSVAMKSGRLEGSRQINTVAVIEGALPLHLSYLEVQTYGGSPENRKNSLCIKASVGSSVWDRSHFFCGVFCSWTCLTLAVWV